MQPLFGSETDGIQERKLVKRLLRKKKITFILTALCALVMPLQGLYWLGKRAKSPLEPQSSQWFYEISERLRKQHESLPTVQDKPTYQHLAEVLRKAQQKLDKAFWQEI